MSETVTFKFYGCSDDTFGEYEETKIDFDNCASGKPIRFELIAPNGEGMIVSGQYCPPETGGWQVSVAPMDADEDSPQIPEWPIRVERSPTEYSPMLVIETPKGVKLRCLEWKEGR